MDPASPEFVPMFASIIAIFFHMQRLLRIVKVLQILYNFKRQNKHRWGGRRAMNRHFIRHVHIRRIIYDSDLACYENTRMDRNIFHSLCDLLSTRGRLQETREMHIEEMVAMFLHIVAHDVKNRIIKRKFVRSGETISRQFGNVLAAILRCHDVLLRKPEPVPENSSDERWKWFKNYLGALDGTHIKVHVPEIDKARYRDRNKNITTNVLGVCIQDMQFIYILLGWKGSAADSRVLRDAIYRPNGLKVSQGHYYFCDAGYPNGERFLTPYRGQRYHLSEWRQARQPQTPQELYNYKHSSARNVIERCFGLLKGRWAILRGKSYYPTKVACRIISACALLHNHIRREMPVDLLENEISEVDSINNEEEMKNITYIETSTGWNLWRDALAQQMWNESRG